MPIDFPSSPTVGQTIPLGSKRYQWTGEQWAASNISRDLWIWKNTNYSASVGDRIAADTDGGGWVLYLPNPPTNEGWVQVVDAKKCWDQAGKNLTIAPGIPTNTIEGLAENLVCDVAGDMVITLVYTGFTWRVYV